jgi:hypothetical protein
MIIQLSLSNSSVEAGQTGHAASGSGAEAAALSTGAGRDEAGSALADGAAGGRTLAVIAALASDELGAGSLAGASSGCGRSSRGSGCSRGGGSATEATALTAGTSGYEAGSALASGAAGRGALAVRAALASDELGASSLARASNRGSGRGRSSRCRRRSGGSSSTSSTNTGLGVVDAGSGGLRTESEGGEVVRRNIAEATASVTLLGDDGGTALAGLEATAEGCAVGVGGACTSDELLAGGTGSTSDGCGRSSRGSRGGGCSRSSGTTSGTLASLRVVDAGSLSLAAECDGRNVVGGDVAEAASTITLLGDYSSSALAGLEATARRGAVSVRGADTGDELGAGTGKDHCGCHEGDFGQRDQHKDRRSLRCDD